MWCYSDEEAVITYYDKDGNALDGAPTDAGSYSVEASVPETAKYRAVTSGKIPFVILPRPAALAISAVGDQSTEGAEVVVTIVGALTDVVGKSVGIDVAYDDPHAMSAQGVGEARLGMQAAATIQAPIENVGGSLVATHKFKEILMHSLWECEEIGFL